MATGTSSFSGTVFSVAVARRPNGSKYNLAGITGLPVFANFGARSWDREYLYCRARGAKAWFLPTEKNGTVFDFYWYRENGGIPYQAVAATSGKNRPRWVNPVDGGFIRSYRSAAHGHAPSRKGGVQTAILTIPEVNESAARASWLTRLINVEDGDVAVGFWRKLSLMTRRLRTGGRRPVSD